MIKFIKINFYYLLVLFVVIVNFNTFEKIYLIYLNNYEERLKSSYGYCDREGYGFVKIILIKDSSIKFFSFKIRKITPVLKDFFYNFITYGKNERHTYLYIINQKDESLIKNFKNYTLKNEVNCYL